MGGNGGIIGPVNTPSGNIASGVWSLAEVEARRPTPSLVAALALVATPLLETQILFMEKFLPSLLARARRPTLLTLPDRGRASTAETRLWPPQVVFRR